MPVTFQVAPHPAEQYSLPSVQPKAVGADNILKAAAYQQWLQCEELLQSSIAPEHVPRLVPRGNGFVEAVLTAYKKHHHLVIRPDDVWIAILSQLNFYINAHADDLRADFVPHTDGKKLLTVSAVGTRYTVDFASMARQMTTQIRKHVVDPSLVDWILPDFTTSTTKDKTICAVMTMSSLKSYFDYRMRCMCGIPSVTLQGERADWQKLLDRVAGPHGRLPALGTEPAAWARMLAPILERFVRAFDGAPDLEFWGDVAHAHAVFYGPDDMSGWITAFSVWDSDGRWQGRPLDEVANPREEKHLNPDERERRYVLDGISYPALSQTQITQGFCEVDVLVDDNGEQFDCMMVAGHVAFAVSGSKTDQRPDTLSPSPEWFMFVKGKREDKLEKLRRRPPMPPPQPVPWRR